MQKSFLLRSLFVILAMACLSLPVRTAEPAKRAINHNNYFSNYNRLRGPRTTPKPGFVRTLFSVIYEQYQDTKKTAGVVNKMINDNFIPENAPQTTIETTTIQNASNVSTTAAPYKITRAEFGRIIRRNLRGLARLLNIELKDALKQSEKNYAEFRRNATLEISKYL